MEVVSSVAARRRYRRPGRSSRWRDCLCDVPERGQGAVCCGCQSVKVDLEGHAQRAGTHGCGSCCSGGPAGCSGGPAGCLRRGDACGYRWVWMWVFPDRQSSSPIAIRMVSPGGSATAAGGSPRHKHGSATQFPSPRILGRSPHRCSCWLVSRSCVPSPQGCNSGFRFQVWHGLPAGLVLCGPAVGARDRARRGSPSKPPSPRDPAPRMCGAHPQTHCDTAGLTVRPGVVSEGEMRYHR